MKVPSELFFFHDRMPVADLGSLNEPLLAAMQQWNIGKVDNKKHIQFCGMVQLANAQTAVFLPRSMDATTLEAASLTMNVLSRFGRETTSRELTSDGETGNPGVLSVIKKLAEDFRTSGIFSERQYVRSRNTGKPSVQSRVRLHLFRLPVTWCTPIFRQRNHSTARTTYLRKFKLLLFARLLISMVGGLMERAHAALN